MYFRKLFYYLCCRCFVKEKNDNVKNDDVSNDITLDISDKKDDDWQQL